MPITDDYPLRKGDRVIHPDYRDEAPRALEREDNPLSGRPAYQDPPIVGYVQYAPPSGRTYVKFPGVGIRIIGAEELTRVEL
jgi:hypothetical protein